MKNRVVLILPFFGGRFPLYFDYWIASVEGRHLDVMIVTDMTDRLTDVPTNVKVLNMSLSDIRGRARAKLGCSVELTSVRKLCDMKPMYGKIFEDEITNYDYWAFGDADLVYGRELDSWLYYLLAQDYDVISFRERWVSGPFCILRNDDKCRNLFARASNLKEVLQNSEYTLFDELSWGGGFDGLTWDRMTVADCERKADSFSAVVWRSADIKRFSKELICEVPLWTGMVHMEPCGRLTIDNMEIPIFHLVRAKQNRAFTVVHNNGCGDYRIDRYGFYVTEGQWRFRALHHLTRIIRSRIIYLVGRIGAVRRHDWRYLYRRMMHVFGERIHSESTDA